MIKVFLPVDFDPVGYFRPGGFDELLDQHYHIGYSFRDTFINILRARFHECDLPWKVQIRYSTLTEIGIYDRFDIPQGYAEHDYAFWIYEWVSHKEENPNVAATDEQKLFIKIWPLIKQDVYQWITGLELSELCQVIKDTLQRVYREGGPDKFVEAAQHVAKAVMESTSHPEAGLIADEIGNPIKG